MTEIRLTVDRKSVDILVYDDRIVVFLRNGEKRFFKTFTGLVDFVKNLDENDCF